MGGIKNTLIPVLLSGQIPLAETIPQ